MPVLIVYGIPKGISAENVALLQAALKLSVIKVGELVFEQSQVSCFMPILHPEPKKIIIPANGWPSSKEIRIFVDGFFAKTEQNAKVRNKLAMSVGKAVKKFFPQATIEVFVRPFDPNQGFWAGR